MGNESLDMRTIRRIEQQERKHRAILEAALTMIEAEGFESLTMPRLAKSLGVAVGGLYRSFPSKERMIVELQGRAVDRLWRRLSHRLRLVEGPPSDEATRALARVVTALQLGLQFEALDPLHHGLLVRLQAQLLVQPPSESDLAWIAARAKPLTDRLVTHLERAVALQVVEPVDLRATLGLWWTTLGAQSALPSKARPASDAVVDTLLRGVGASGFQLSEARRLIDRADVG